MSIDYERKNNILYASIGVSKRSGKKVIKEKTYLGRVLDKEKGIYKNRQRGIFTYDPATNTYGTPPSDYVPPKLSRKKEKLILDFGDAFMTAGFLQKSCLAPAIKAISYGNPDTLWAMILFYILTDYANVHASDWYNGNYAKILYPKANLSSQRISDFLCSIGDEYSFREFFSVYLKQYAKSENNPSDPNLLIDSTGLPNSNHLPITAVSNHNGTVEEEIRLIYVTQKETGWPVYFRYIPGNIVDKTTLERTRAELKQYGIDIASCILDAGYVTYEMMKSFFESDIRFLTRLGRQNEKLYNFIFDQGIEGLESPENAILQNGRIIYCRKVAFHLDDYIGCSEEYTGYGYICLDTTTRQKQLKHESDIAEKNNAALFREKQRTDARGRKPEKERKLITGADVVNSVKTSGVYILVSSANEDCSTIVTNYATRDRAEKVFEIGKESAKLLPLNVENVETFRGHLLLSFIAATAIKMIQQKLKSTGISWNSAKINTRNQKCKVYDTTVISEEVDAKNKMVYDSLNLHCPVYL